jgi:ribosomal protein L3
MITERMIKRREQAKKLRAQGMTYKEIGEEIGVSGTMARHYVNGRPSANSRKTPKREHGPYSCTHIKNGTKCERQAGHRGVHSANKNKKLLYWE